MAQQDYVAILATVGTILGGLGGIPQLLRWFGNHPKLSVDNVNLWYTPLANSDTFYTYLENGKAHAVPARIWISFRIGNAKTRLRWLRRSDATGIVVAVSLHTTRTGERIHNLSHNESTNVLPSNAYEVVREGIMVSLSEPEYRVRNARPSPSQAEPHFEYSNPNQRLRNWGQESKARPLLDS